MGEKSEKNNVYDSVTTDDHNSTLNKCVFIFISVYVLLTVAELSSLAHNTNVFGNKTFEGVVNYLTIALLCAVLHVWVYATLKCMDHFKKLKTLYPDSVQYQKVLKKMDHLRHPFPYLKGGDATEIFIKIAYFLLWIFLVRIIVICCHEIGYYNFNDFSISINRSGIVFIGNKSERWASAIFILLLIGAILNYYSHYQSIVFTFFCREISKIKDIKSEREILSNSEEFRTLNHIASRVSISFLSVSVLYTIILAETILLWKAEGKNSMIFKGMLIFSAILMCGASFAVVSVLPKAFLNRMLRNYKFRKTKFLRDNFVYDEKRYSSVWNDKLPLTGTEIIMGSFSVLMQIVSFALSIIFQIK